VDDVFAVLPSDSHLNNILSQLNQCVPSIKFTLEKETDVGLPFLDVLVKRGSNGFPSFKIYKKATHNDSYVHWFSPHPKKIKMGIVVGFFTRAHRICSPQYLDDEICRIRDVFKRLAYPKLLVDDALSRCRKRFYSSDAAVSFNFNNVLVVPIATQKMEKILHPDINIITNNCNNIGSFLKNTNHNTVTSGGVYRIPCMDCESAYIGETNDFKRRMYQHEYALRTGDINSSLYNHRVEMNHRIRTSDAGLIMKTDSAEKRLLYEAFIINNVDSFNINKNNLIDRFTNKVLLQSSKLTYFLKNLNNIT